MEAPTRARVACLGLVNKKWKGSAEVVREEKEGGELGVYLQCWA